MIKNIDFQNTTIRFEDKGEGKTVVLLHGYLESLDIWDSFADELSENYRVITIDLLGHGKSGVVSETHSMELMADAVFEVVKYLEIEKCTLIGHSMGGYVAMAFLEKYETYLEGLSLFHSTPLSDSEPTKILREKTISEIRNGKKIEICKNHVPKTFAKNNTEKYIQEIGFGKIIALNTPDEGIIAALNGMKQRKNRVELLKNTKIPFLYILGKKDNFIPSNILSHFELPCSATIGVLDNSGHQGYIEEKNKSLKIVSNFLKKI